VAQSDPELEGFSHICITFIRHGASAEEAEKQHMQHLFSRPDGHQSAAKQASEGNEPSAPERDQ